MSPRRPCGRAWGWCLRTQSSSTTPSRPTSGAVCSLGACAQLAAPLDATCYACVHALCTQHAGAQLLRHGAASCLHSHCLPSSSAIVSGLPKHSVLRRVVAGMGGRVHQMRRWRGLLRLLPCMKASAITSLRAMTPWCALELCAAQLTEWEPHLHRAPPAVKHGASCCVTASCIRLHRATSSCVADLLMS